MQKKAVIIFLIIILVIVGFWFFSKGNMQGDNKVLVDNKQEKNVIGSWKDIELTDASTGEKFTINDFKGRSILIESFAVWCPTCLRQQKEVKKLKESDGDAIIHISLDTDPNEDIAQVKEHALKNNLDWYFAVSPIELTRALIDEFGQTVVNAPSAPVVLICADQSARLLQRGVKTASELKNEAGKGC